MLYRLVRDPTNIDCPYAVQFSNNGKWARVAMFNNELFARNYLRDCGVEDADILPVVELSRRRPWWNPF